LRFVLAWIPAFERVKKLASPSIVMAGLDPAIQQLSAKPLIVKASLTG
jgi:hypothetical protein